MEEIVMGVDPGNSGGFAVLSANKEVIATAKFDGLTETDTWDAMKEYTLSPNLVMVVLEEVSAMPDQGVTSVFTFGDSWGFLRGLLVASAARREYVRPQKWQKIFSLPTTKECGSKTAKKNANKAEAQRQFPSVKMTHAIADALLIAEYARRISIERAVSK
jgi:hypothetical protein